MTERDRALELRDLALAVLRARGAWRSVRGADASIQVLNFDGDGLSILYRTPFQQLPQLTEMSKYARRAVRHDPKTRQEDWWVRP